jgi:hypothetical protein
VGLSFVDEVWAPGAGGLFRPVRTQGPVAA